HRAYRIAYRLTGNREDAEDLTQDAYLRAYRSFATFDGRLPFENWFFRILTNRFYDLMRQRRGRSSISLDQPVNQEGSGDNLQREVADEEADPERCLMTWVMEERLQTALRALPLTYRAAVLLCDVEGKSYAEIAAIMRTSIGTVRSRIHRGRGLLRRIIEG